MKKNLLVGTLVVALSGCSTLNNLNENSERSNNGAYSKYHSDISSQKKLDEYVNLARQEQGKVVEDDNGKYYFKVNDNHFLRAMTNRTNIDNTNYKLEKSIGVMTPVYTMQKTTNWTVGGKPGLSYKVDWNLTKKRWHFFKDKMNLKLLPLSETKKLAKALEEASLSSGDMFPTWDKGDMNSIIEKAGIKAGYVVDNGLITIVYSLVPLNSAKNRILGGYNVTDDKANTMMILTLSVVNGNNISFYPSEIFKNETVAGFYQRDQCSYNNIDQYSNLLKLNSGSLSGLVNYMFTDSKGETYHDKQFSKINTQYNLAIARQHDYENSFLSFCDKAFKELGVSGYINSEKLK